MTKTTLPGSANCRIAWLEAFGAAIGEGFGVDAGVAVGAGVMVCARAGAGGGEGKGVGVGAGVGGLAVAAGPGVRGFPGAIVVVAGNGVAVAVCRGVTTGVGLAVLAGERHAEIVTLITRVANKAV